MASGAIMPSTFSHPGEAHKTVQVQVQSPSMPESNPSLSSDQHTHLDSADSATKPAIATSSAIPASAKIPSTVKSDPETPLHRNLHAHRQNHNSSKLPAFRFADLKANIASAAEKETLCTLTLPSLLQKPQVESQPLQQQQKQKQKLAQRHLHRDSIATPSTHAAPSSPPGTTTSTTATTLGRPVQTLQGSTLQGSTLQEEHPHHLHSAADHDHHDPATRQHHHYHHYHNQQQQQGPGSRQRVAAQQQASSPKSSVTAAAPSSSIDPQRDQSVSPQPTPTASAPTSASVSASASTTSDRTNNTTHSANHSPADSTSSTFQTTPSAGATPIISSFAIRRPYSFPDSPSATRVPVGSGNHANSKSPPSSSSTAQVGISQHRRANTDSEAATSSLNARRALAAASGSQPLESTATKEWAQGQRELLLPGTLQDDQADDKRKHRSRPPVSFRRPRNDSAGVRVPPIRSFRSSGSRKSWSQDLTIPKPTRSHDEGSGDDSMDPNARDRTLWALEGRTPGGGYIQMTPPDSAEATPDGESTGDIFMRIAREDPSPAQADDGRQAQDPSAVSRITRSSHRRPLSAAIPSYQRTSPPQVTRRLSDQRETARPHRAAIEQSAQQMTRDLAQRAVTRERPQQTDDTQRARLASQGAKSSPVTPRSVVGQDTADSVSYGRRRGSIPDNSVPPPSRTSLFKTTYGHSRTYNSSPLVPRHTEPHTAEGAGHGQGVEGTESSASTAAPSTVWDELDDIRSRIHRLELTGKVPATSNNAMSRVSDDRPPTANTNATTLSGSPRRGSGHVAADASSTTSSSRESHPILLSAVSKSKPFLSPDAFGALEAAASDALALSQMMGAPGQPGPISSGASTIGAGTNLTDRQLRKKADSICRSLTELCLALADEGTQKKNATATAAAAREKEISMATSPTARSFSLADGPRRAAAVGEAGLSRLNTATLSPRAFTRTQERRATLLGTGTLPSPRFTMTPAVPTVAEPTSTGRKSSLLISRTRRAATEEPEESSARSTLLRTRRAGTEEPEEGRRTSFLQRGSHRAYDDEEDGPRFRAPSRATTDVGLLKHIPRDYVGQQQQQQTQQQHASSPSDASNPSSSALPRRRLVPSSLNARLIAPSAPTALSGRRYLERGTPERDVGNTILDKLADDRAQRQFSVGAGFPAAAGAAALNRTSSLNRRRDSLLPGLGGASGGSQVGGYR